MKNPLFEISIMILIFVNCIFYIWDKKGKDFEKVESIFMIIYTLEMILNMFCFGLYHSKYAYFKKGWNLIDFSIIILYFAKYYLPEFFQKKDLPNFGAFRAVRIIKVIPLREFQIMIFALWNSFFIVSQSLIIFVLFAMMFSIIGFQMFSDLLKNRCIKSIYGIPVENYCGNLKCEKSFICGKTLENPDHGLTNFDSFFFSFIQILRVITFDNWTVLMNFYQKTLSQFAFIFFLIVATIGKYFLNNFILAVIKVKFTDSWNQLKKLENENKDTLNKRGKIYELRQIRKIGGIWSKFRRNISRNEDENTYRNSILSIKNDKTLNNWSETNKKNSWFKSLTKNKENNKKKNFFKNIISSKIINFTNISS